MSKKQSLSVIKLTGYKSIRELGLELKPLNILIGANGAGKSNFLSVFTLLRNIINRKLERYVTQQGGADYFLHFGQKTTEKFKIELEFGDNLYKCMLAPVPGDTLFFSDESAYYWDRKHEDPYREFSRSGHRETRLVDDIGTSTSTIAGYVVEAIKNWELYHFHDTSPSAKIKKTHNIYNNLKLLPDASNLAAFLYLLSQTDTDRYYYHKIITTVRLTAPFFYNFLLYPDNNNNIILRWQDKGSDTPFTADYLSDGTLRFICLVTLLLQPDNYLPSTIIIDEPELGLHPHAITILAALLKKASKRTQVIVATQSVTLVNQFEPEDIIVVDRKGDESSFRRCTYEELEPWLDDFEGCGLGDLWEKNIIGGRP